MQLSLRIWVKRVFYLLSTVLLLERFHSFAGFVFSSFAFTFYEINSAESAFVIDESDVPASASHGSSSYLSANVGVNELKQYVGGFLSTGERAFCHFTCEARIALIELILEREVEAFYTSIFHHVYKILNAEMPKRPMSNVLLYA